MTYQQTFILYKTNGNEHILANLQLPCIKCNANAMYAMQCKILCWNTKISGRIFYIEIENGDYIYYIFCPNSFCIMLDFAIETLFEILQLSIFMCACTFIYI